MPENNEVIIKIETEESEKPDFLIDESEEKTEKLNETEERSIETVKAELEALKEDLKNNLKQSQNLNGNSFKQNETVCSGLSLKQKIPKNV